MGIEDDVRLRLHAQLALLGHVTTSLRSVSLDIENEEKRVRAPFVYDGPPGETELEVASVVATEIITHYTADPGWRIEEEYLNVPRPDRMEFPRLLVFERYERGASD